MVDLIRTNESKPELEKARGDTMDSADQIRVMQMLREAKCPKLHCDNKGQRLVPIHNWYEPKSCDWCEERQKLLEKNNG